MRDVRVVVFTITRPWRERLFSRPWRPWLNAWLYEGRGGLYEGPLSTPDWVDVKCRAASPLTKRLGRA